MMYNKCNIQNIIDLMMTATDLENYNRVSKIFKSNDFDIKFNSNAIIEIIERNLQMEVKYFLRYRQKGAAFILLEKLAELEPSTQWIQISEPTIHILQQLLIASREILVTVGNKDGWMFIQIILNIISKLVKNCNHIAHICEQLIVLIVSGLLNYDQIHAVGERLNCISCYFTKTERTSVNDNLMKYFPKIASLIVACGHYPCQYGMLETLIRWSPVRDVRNPDDRKNTLNVLFPKNVLSTDSQKIFMERSWTQFVKDSRDFLNSVNQNSKLIQSVEIVSAMIDNIVIFKHSVWWLDLNVTSRAISLMVPRIVLTKLYKNPPIDYRSVAVYLTVANTDSITLQRLGHNSVLTMKSIDSIELVPFLKNTTWRTMIVRVSQRYVEVLDETLKHVFGQKYKFLNDEGPLVSSQGETSNFSESDAFSIFSDPQKQNSRLLTLKRIAASSKTSSKKLAETQKQVENKACIQIPHMESVSSIDIHTAPAVNNIQKKTEEPFDYLSSCTGFKKDDTRKGDIPNVTLPNSVEELLSPYNNVNIGKTTGDPKKFGLQEWDNKTVESFFEHNFKNDNLNKTNLIIDESSSDDSNSVEQDRQHALRTEITKVNIVNSEINNSIMKNSEKKIPEESKRTTIKRICNIETTEYGNTIERIENKSIILNDDYEETSVFKEEIQNVLKEDMAHETIERNEPNSSILLLNSLELKDAAQTKTAGHLCPNSVPFKTKDQENITLDKHDNISQIDVTKTAGHLSPKSVPFKTKDQGNDSLDKHDNISRIDVTKTAEYLRPKSVQFKTKDQGNDTLDKYDNISQIDVTKTAGHLSPKSVPFKTKDQGNDTLDKHDNISQIDVTKTAGHLRPKSVQFKTKDQGNVILDKHDNISQIDATKTAGHVRPKSVPFKTKDQENITLDKHDNILQIDVTKSAGHLRPKSIPFKTEDQEYDTLDKHGNSSQINVTKTAIQSRRKSVSLKTKDQENFTVNKNNNISHIHVTKSARPLLGKTVSLKRKDQENVTLNQNGSKINLYKYSRENEKLLKTVFNKDVLPTKRRKLYNIRSNYPKKRKGRKAISKIAKGKGNKRSKAFLQDAGTEVMRAEHFKHVELVKVTDKVNELEPVLMKIPQTEIIEENVARENKKAHKATKKSVQKANIVKTVTKNNGKVKDNLFDVTSKKIDVGIENTKWADRNKTNESSNEIEVVIDINGSSDGNENKKNSLRMAKENDATSSSLKTIVTSSTIRALNKTYVPRNLEYAYLNSRRKELVNDLLKKIDNEESKKTFIAEKLAGQKQFQLRISVERTSLNNISRASSRATKTKSLAKPNLALIPTVLVEKLSTKKIAQILSESGHNSRNVKSKKSNGCKAKAKYLVSPLEARVEKSIEKLSPEKKSTAHTKKRQLETLTRCTKNKFFRDNGGHKHVPLWEWINTVDPRPEVPLPEQIKDLNKMIQEKIDTSLTETQIDNTNRIMDMCINVDKKIDDLFESQCKINALKTEELEKNFSDLLIRENNHTTERWREAFSSLHDEFKANAELVLAQDVRNRKLFIRTLREDIDNMLIGLYRKL